MPWAAIAGARWWHLRQLQLYGLPKGQLCGHDHLHGDYWQHLHERCTFSHNNSTRFSCIGDAPADGYNTGPTELQLACSCWCRQGMRASTPTRHSQATGTCCPPACVENFPQPSDNRLPQECTRQLRLLIPAADIPTSADYWGEVCYLYH